MAKRKTFEHGQDVEVRRDVGAPWENATYDRQRDPGQHTVQFHADAPPRWRVVMGHPTEFRWVTVPSVRIRTVQRPALPT